MERGRAARAPRSIDTGPRHAERYSQEIYFSLESAKEPSSVWRMQLHYSPGLIETNTLSTEALRENFLIEGLFRRGELIATGEETVASSSLLVHKNDVDYEIWNRLLGRDYRNSVG